MRTALPFLLFLAACSGPEETDTDDTLEDTDVREYPYVNLVGEWWLEDGRLPAQSESWCELLTPSRFDTLDGCFSAPTACTQGLRFGDVDGYQLGTWLVIVEGTACDDTGAPVTRYGTSNYGSFVFEGPTDEDLDRWQVSSFRWVVETLEDDPPRVEVTSNGNSWHMVKEFRWDDL